MRLFAHELRGQLLLYVRSKELAFFTFLLPLILFVLLGSVYGHDRIEGYKGSRYLEAGMLGYGVVSTAFAGLAIFMLIRRESGILKRVRATPLPPWTYITAVLAATMLAYALNSSPLNRRGRVCGASRGCIRRSGDPSASPLPETGATRSVRTARDTSSCGSTSCARRTRRR